MLAQLLDLLQMILLDFQIQQLLKVEIMQKQEQILVWKLEQMFKLGMLIWMIWRMGLCQNQRWRVLVIGIRLMVGVIMQDKVI